MWSSRLFYLMGCWVLVLAGFQTIPLAIALVKNDTDTATAFLSSFFFCALIGGSLFLGFQSSARMKVRRLTVLLPIVGAMCLALCSGLPFFFRFPELGFIPALYEGFSLITTNGASAYEGATETSYAITFWRGLASWIGGFVAICTTLSILTAMNSGGLQLHRSPLPYGDSVVGYPRLKSVATTVMPIYIIVTTFCAFLLMLFGSPLEEAAIFAMATISTAGVSPSQDGMVAGFGQQLVILVFMVISLMNWDVLYARLRGLAGKHPQGAETRSIAIVLGIALFMLLLVTFPLSAEGWWHALFMAVSALSTSGFHPADMQISDTGLVTGGIIFAVLACLGGAVASTTGGVKQLRVIIIYFLGRAEVDRLAHPHGVTSLKFQGFSIERGDVEAVWLLIGGFVLSIVGGCLALAILGIDFHAALAMTISALTLSGPLVSAIDPYFAGFSGLTNADYLILSVLMVVGRVEASLFLALTARAFWKG